MTQLTLLTPGVGGLETPTIQERLLARTEDPATSKAAAARVARSLAECQAFALYVIDTYGPGTLREIADAYTKGAFDPRWVDTTKLYHELARRAPELAREGLIGYQRDARGLAVRVDGARVWEVSV